MTEAVYGFGEHDINAFLWGDWYGNERVGGLNVPRPVSLGVVAKLRRKRHLSAEEFTYLRRRTTRIPKITLPSPTLWANFWSKDKSASIYPTLDSFLGDVVAILRDEVTELVRLGATYIQIDAPHYTAMLDPHTRAFYEGQGWPLQRWLQEGIELDNSIIEGFTDVTFAVSIFAAVIRVVDGSLREVMTCCLDPCFEELRLNAYYWSTTIIGLARSSLFEMSLRISSSSWVL
jgi:5-methyltetrahydropteroyltriglutamate--homocysteine methyltransferase